MRTASPTASPGISCKAYCQLVSYLQDAKHIKVTSMLSWHDILQLFVAVGETTVHLAITMRISETRNPQGEQLSRRHTTQLAHSLLAAPASDLQPGRCLHNLPPCVAGWICPNVAQTHSPPCDKADELRYSDVEDSCAGPHGPQK